MPQPTPRKNEGHEAFNKRCMDNAVMKKEFPDRKQRFAACQSQWRGRNKQTQSAIDTLEDRRPIEPRLRERRGANG